ncbi:MAG TPA: GNAT family N-acetyltransferase [Firmicutes bacterium]|jgi:ribosomal protein S18 acetylase RimI-like enzyme|nr:GNAT family N-acetyltransferase [Bacillota bacterium]
MRFVEEPIGDLKAYGTVPIAFLVRSRLRCEPIAQGWGGIRLIEESVQQPYVKDYDQEENPTEWLKLGDLSNWGVIAVYDGLQRVGGAVLAWNTPGIRMLDGQSDRAVLWDIRVHPDYRGKGIGRGIFSSAVEWARKRDCRLFKVETQNINVPACRLYMNQGCTLAVINSFAYPEYPDEVQLIWQMRL